MPAPALTLTNREIVRLYEGIVALDGMADKDGKVARFELDDGAAWNLAKNRRIIEGAIDTYQKARKALGGKHGIVEGMQITPANAGAVALFMAAGEELLDRTNDLPGLLKVKLGDLQRAGVKTPGTLSNLIPILDDK